MTVKPDTFATHFTRVLPIVGDHMREVCIAVAGTALSAPLVEHLAACGVGRWLWRDDGGDTEGLINHLDTRHGTALDLDATIVERSDWPLAVHRRTPDLILATGDRLTLLAALTIAEAARRPAFLVAQPLDTHPCRALCVFPGDESATAARWIRRSARGGVNVLWDWATSAPLLAGVARAMLLRGTPFAREDLTALWNDGIREVSLGGAHPFDVQWNKSPRPSSHLPHVTADIRHSTLSDVRAQRSTFNVQHSTFHTPTFRTPRSRRGTLLIAGLGSLGSVAAEYLAPVIANAVLADPDLVEEANPVRQAYNLTDIGRPKASALRERLLAAGVPHAVALEQALADDENIAVLIAQYGVTTAIIATGMAADFAIARACRAAGIPHIVARCYPRARYWEAILVDGANGPALDDMRGRLIPGPAPSPTPEQRRAYSDGGALEAEPATLIESGWTAAWLARLTAQFLAPVGLRERWFLELVSAGRTCLVGGVGVERTAGGAAYGVNQPGEIHAWGRGNVELRIEN